ncbi:MAG: hypothetical protein AAFQ82_23935 [Myxococcota bacterium]
MFEDDFQFTAIPVDEDMKAELVDAFARAEHAAEGECPICQVYAKRGMDMHELHGMGGSPPEARKRHRPMSRNAARRFRKKRLRRN